MTIKEIRKANYFSWQLIILIAATWSAIEAPVSYLKFIPIKESHLWWDGIISSLFVADIFFRLKGKFPQEKDINPVGMIFQKANSSKPYYKSHWFIIDVISSLPYDIILALTGVGYYANPLMRTLRMLRVLRIFKFRNIYSTLDALPRGFRVGLIFSIILVTLHWIACGWMAINGGSLQDDFMTTYNKSLYWAVTTLTTVGYGDIAPNSNLSRVYTMIVMILGVASYGIIIGNVSRLLLMADRHNEAKKEKVHDLNMFMKYYNVPISLQRQVFSFYHHILEKRMSDKDTQIINDLPSSLQNELQLYMKIKMIRSVHIFNGLNTACLKMIAERLKQKFYSPGEHILKKGDEANEMFILGHGEVQVMSGETVITNLKNGQFFGEMALLEDSVRSADVVASSYCDLYIFEREDFELLNERFPELKERFENIGRRRKTDSLSKENKQVA